MNSGAGTTTFTCTVSGSPASPATPVTGQSLTAGKDNEFETLESGATATWSASGLAAASYTVYAHLNLYDGDNNPLTDLDSQAQYTVTCGGVPTTVTGRPEPGPGHAQRHQPDVQQHVGPGDGDRQQRAVDNNSLTAGSIVHISGATPSQYDGTFVVQSASSTTFTYTLASGLNLAAATGTITAGLNDVWISLGTYTTSGTVSVAAYPHHRRHAQRVDGRRRDGTGRPASRPPCWARRRSATPTRSRHPPATLAPGQYAVMVSNYAAFEERYNPTGTNNILVLGVYSGHLGNGGDTVDIYQIGNRDNGSVAAPNGYVPFYRVDHVNYNNAAPWPTEPDGNGPALIRIHTADYGNDAINWEASNAGGTPGQANVVIDSSTPSTPANLAAQAVFSPTAEISLAWTASSDPESYVAYYVIYRNGVSLGTSTTNSYVDTAVVTGTNYIVLRECRQPRRIRQRPIGYRSSADLPGVASYDWLDTQDVEIYFNEPLTTASATVLSHYSMSGGFTFTAVALSRNGTKVTLTTGQAFAIGNAYTITMTGLATVSGDQLPASLPLSVTYQPPTGEILDQVWDGLDGGDTINDLTSPALNPNYPNNPTITNYLTSFEAPYNTGVSDYGQRGAGLPLSAHHAAITCSGSPVTTTASYGFRRTPALPTSAPAPSPMSTAGRITGLGPRIQPSNRCRSRWWPGSAITSRP